MKNYHQANIKRALNAISGCEVRFLRNGNLIFGKVLNKWDGTDPRIVVAERNGTRHYIRDIENLQMYHYGVQTYLSPNEYGKLMLQSGNCR